MTEPPFWSYSGSKWGHRPKIGCVTKNKRCPKSQTPFYFSSERPEIELIWTHRPGVQVDSILGQKLSLVLDTAIVLQQISKRWSTLAARNSTLNTLYPPLANIFWTLWTMDWVIRFWAIFGIFWGQDYIGKISDFQKGWLAINKLKPLSLFISLLLMPKNAFDNTF